MNLLDKMRVCLKSHGAPGVMIHGGTQSLEFCANSSIEKDDLSLFKPGNKVTVGGHDESLCREFGIREGGVERSDRG